MDFTKPWVHIGDHSIDVDHISSVTRLSRSSRGTSKYRTVLTFEGGAQVYLEMRKSEVMRRIDEAIAEAEKRSRGGDALAEPEPDISAPVGEPYPTVRMPLVITLRPEWMEDFRLLNNELGKQLNELAPERASGFLLMPAKPGIPIQTQAQDILEPYESVKPGSITDKQWADIQAEAMLQADKAQGEFRAEERSRELKRQGKCGVINPRTLMVCTLRHNPALHRWVGDKLQHVTEENDGQRYDWFVEA